jgi:hypothetical protein
MPYNGDYISLVTCSPLLDCLLLAATINAIKPASAVIAAAAAAAATTTGITSADAVQVFVCLHAGPRKVKVTAASAADLVSHLCIPCWRSLHASIKVHCCMTSNNCVAQLCIISSLAYTGCSVSTTR